MGLDYAQRHYGKLSRQQVMAPAIRLARQGFILTRADTDILDTTVNRFRTDAQAARWFLRPDGSPLQPGDNLKQPELAETLSHISQSGTDYFYKQPIPQRVEAAAAKGGQLLLLRTLSVIMSPKVHLCGVTIGVMNLSLPHLPAPVASRFARW